VRAREVRRREVALAVDTDDGVPLALFHVESHAVAQNAGVVDEDVEAAEGVDGLLDEVFGPLPVRDVVEVRSGLAAEGLDLLDNLTGRAVVRPRAVPLTAQVVDDDLRALTRELERVSASDSASRTGDDCHFVFEQRHTHAS